MDNIRTHIGSEKKNDMDYLNELTATKDGIHSKNHKREEDLVKARHDMIVVYCLRSFWRRRKLED